MARQRMAATVCMLLVAMRLVRLLLRAVESVRMGHATRAAPCACLVLLLLPMRVGLLVRVPMRMVRRRPMRPHTPGLHRPCRRGRGPGRMQCTRSHGHRHRPAMPALHGPALRMGWAMAPSTGPSCAI